MVYRVRFFRTEEKIGDFDVFSYTRIHKERTTEIALSFGGLQRLFKQNWDFVCREWSANNGDAFPAPIVADFNSETHLQTYRWDFDGETFILAVDTMSTIEDGA